MKRYVLMFQRTWRSVSILAMVQVEFLGLLTDFTSSHIGRDAVFKFSSSGAKSSRTRATG